MNTIDDALDRLMEALRPLLPPGRVSPVPISNAVGPAIWVDSPSLSPNRLQGATAWYVDFPVWVVYDGADEAQLAGLNDLLARMLDACAGVKLCWPSGVRPGELRDSPDWRAQVMTIRMTITSRSFCLPAAPVEAPIPPDPIDIVA